MHSFSRAQILRSNHVRTKCHVPRGQWSWSNLSRRSWTLVCLCAAMLLLVCSASAATTTGSAHTRCNADQFQCRNGNCILQAKMCDGRSDCTDNSDELECGKSAVARLNLHNSNLDLTSNSKSLLQLFRLQALPAAALVPVFKAARCLLGSGTNMQRHRQLSWRRG